MVTADVDTKAPPTQPANYYASVQTTIRDVRERWTKERQGEAFKVLCAKGPPLMKRYSRKSKVPSTPEEIRSIYASAGESDKLTIDVFDGEHDFNPPTAYEFFDKWLGPAR